MSNPSIPRGPRGWRRLLVANLLGLCLASCGYSSGVRLPEGAQTVGVTVFDNLGPEPQVERDLFARLTEQASHMLDAKLVTPDRADVVVEGKIIDYRRLQGTLSKEGQLQQSGVRITLEAWLVDRRLESRIGEHILVDQAVRYVVRAGEEEFGAREAALAHLCQELILDLFNQVDYGTPEENADVVPVEMEILQPLEPRTTDTDVNPEVNV